MTGLRLVALTLALAAALAAGAADPLEGDWQVNGGGATLRFAAARDGSLDIVWLDGPALDIAPGTCIGSAVPGASRGLYDCRVETALDGSGKRRATTFALRLDAGADSFSMEAYRRNRRISVRRLLPYLFRVAVIESPNRPAGLDGARRLGAPEPFIVL